ncbi:protein GP45.2, partial [Lutimaribacter sp. EGI FJ00015]|nr:protein GP45.2 [Lutimaribacter sp. EGI FJ00015]
TFPELKRYVLTNNFSGEEHVVTEQHLKDAFGKQYDKISSNRHPAWTVSEFFE